MLIGLNGSKGSGKDTVGKYLIDNYGFQRLSFADKLKQSAASLFHVPVHKWEEWKNDDSMKVAVYKSGNDMWEVDTNGPHSIMTVRHFLQMYGTESHRNIFGDDFWVEALLKDFDLFDGKNYVITDARFANELRKIKELGGFNIRINRRTDNPEDLHASEQMPPAVYIDEWIDNFGTYEDLYRAVDKFMSEFPMIPKYGSLSKTTS